MVQIKIWQVMRNKSGIVIRQTTEPLGEHTERGNRVLKYHLGRHEFTDLDAAKQYAEAMRQSARNRLADLQAEAEAEITVEGEAAEIQITGEVA